MLSEGQGWVIYRSPNLLMTLLLALKEATVQSGEARAMNAQGEMR